MQLEISEDMLKVQQVETRLETTKEPPTNSPIKDLETVKLEYELIEFKSKAAEGLAKAV